MTVDEFGSALAEFAPDDTKVVMSITTGQVVISAIPRNKDSDSLPERQFSVATSKDFIDEVELGLALEELFPEAVAFAKAENDKKQAELTAAEKKSKERVAEKIQQGRKPKGNK
jgi:hypothetical protein